MYDPSQDEAAQEEAKILTNGLAATSLPTDVKEVPSDINADTDEDDLNSRFQAQSDRADSNEEASGAPASTKQWDPITKVQLLS